MRLIDADALKSYMDECSKETKFRVYYGYAESFINDSPTIDAVPVVRCRECKHCRKMIGNSYHYCVTHNTKMYSEDFCSYGKRKEGAENG